MTLERQAKHHFLELLEIPPAERDAYLAVHCADPALAERVIALLRQHDAPPPPHETPVSARLGDKATDRPIPTRIGRYDIKGVAGVGGMATVYRAFDAKLGRDVAIKVLTPGYALSETNVARFHKEARLAAKLRHPSIVTVHDSGEHTDVPYLVMEFIDGTTLADRLDAVEAEATPRTRKAFDRVADLVAEVADALEHAHRNNVIHRDVKPSNVLIDQSGQPHLADFGIAHDLSNPSSEPRTIGIAGTCSYMSPEQAQARRSDIDHRSDVYSLGTVLYEALTGEPPFGGDDARDTLRQVVEDDARRVRSLNADVPRDLAVICEKAIEKEPRNRYQTAASLAGDLRAFRAGAPILARPPSTARRAGRWMLKHRLSATLFAALLLAVSTVGLVVTREIESARRACQLSITTTTPAAQVFIAGFETGDDVPTGWRPIGHAPAEERLSPGRYRVCVVADDGRFGEADVRFFADSERVTLHVPVFDNSVTAGMVELSGRPYQLGDPAHHSPFQRARTVELRPFYIDRYEVSNADYLEYVLATDSPRPVHWKTLTDDAIQDRAFLSRPVVGLTVDAMEQYARWRGKRLPTSAEWEAACAIHPGRPYPWGAEASALWPVVTEFDRPRASAVRDRAELLRLYTTYTRPVGSDAALASRHGCFHMAGNVAEMTSTWDLDMGRVVLTKGGSWYHHQSTLDLCLVGHHPAPATSFRVGFRLARSAEPVSDAADATAKE